jgi:RNA polymerase sigma-70 factor (ECF subfamily)
MEQSPETLHDRVAGIYEALREKVFRYLLIMGIEPDQARELCQETFLRLYASLREGEDIGNIPGWVFTVARNCGLQARQRERKFEDFDALAESHMVAKGLDPEQALLRREDGRRLDRAVAQLTPQERHCLHLRAEGLRYREIAEVVGIKTSTVGGFLRRGINRLREALYE